MNREQSGVKVLALTFGELTTVLQQRYGKGAYHAAALYREIFKRGSISLKHLPEFSRSQAFARQLERDLELPACRIVAQEEKGVLKFASALSDGGCIESVIISAPGRTTLCLSSQVGCRMGCRFCATGEMGFVRNLEPEEIVWQLFAARFLLGRGIDNIVFMGMGEPLDNFEAVLQAMHVLNDQRGFNVAYSHMTLSTCGHADGIRRLGALHLPQLRLAVSLNAANDALRSRLMPINTRYPLIRLKEELQEFPLGRKGVLFMEYVLLRGVNDSRAHALDAVRYLEGLPVRVNVIPYNGGAASAYEPPSREHVHRFCQWLGEEGIFVSLRRSRGGSIRAGCGQLGASLAASGCSVEDDGCCIRTED
ncbi:23S rRNA (adenine(2503)-C(2))-methyltransferase RlmN [Desulforhabdus sp. TSK]|uniref:23S rRNA (adenine(2503)-C(2))-methyltransferase RlmN n=1 Tax=Desulforhabdus sp. TSK TaxID=2925014 RepID=UPI001FC7F86E|nr:23S rRNA (adenine(2503)-C(2))-methyltransferase RlmN [Desulforhabdus sp. TSK]GKT09988.1 dual-specificity RNA methyltransferase RlmN [Desulforhabdus sp. TSK]